MIDYIKGELISKNPTLAILETNGIAFILKIPLSTYNSLGEIGKSVRIFTYLSFKNERGNHLTIEIFGFATKEERNLFTDLISVQGVGGGVALRIMSNIKIEEFESAIAREDRTLLSQIKGIGPKTAEKLIFGLQGRYESRFIGIKEDAIRAIVSLGFKREEAQKVVKQIDSESLEQIVKEALKRL